MPDSLFKLLDDLIKPGNWPFLVVFAVVLVAFAAFVILWIIAYLKKEDLDISKRFGPLWIHLTGGPNDPKTQPQPFRKVLHVKVVYLSNRAIKASPFYVRTVDRLEQNERNVPVFDEAVYSTLKLFSGKRKLDRESDSSHGVVDSRLIVPWQSQIPFFAAETRTDPHQVGIETHEESDSLLLVSHFLNGLQGPTQSFSTCADQDAGSLRLIVDFSSIPNAASRIAFDSVQLTLNDQSIDGDGFGKTDCGGSVYEAHCLNAKKGAILKLTFKFVGWDDPAVFGGA